MLITCNPAFAQGIKVRFDRLGPSETRRISPVDRISVENIENLFSTDLAYLQEFYRKINEEQGTPKHHITCPKCAHEFDIDMVSGAPIAEGGDGRPPG